MSRTSFAGMRLLARLAAPVFLASALGACSSIPDWTDPTGWFGSDSQASSDQSGSATADATQTSGQTPDLAGIPPKPTPPSTPDEQQQVANSLAADRMQAQYSAEALQGGTEPVAAPPPPESSDTSATPSTPPPPADQSGAGSPAPAAAASTEEAPSPDTSTSAANTSATTAAATAAPERAAADSSGTQVASTESAATTAPAAAPMVAATSNAPPAVDMQAGFAPSHAPALDASVTQYVPQRILYRYQQTAAAAAVPGVEGMSASVAAKPVHRRKTTAAQTEPAADTAAPPAQ
jgi:hypothetical protein